MRRIKMEICQRGLLNPLEDIDRSVNEIRQYEKFSRCRADRADTCSHIFLCLQAVMQELKLVKSGSKNSEEE